MSIFNENDYNRKFFDSFVKRVVKKDVEDRSEEYKKNKPKPKPRPKNEGEKDG